MSDPCRRAAEVSIADLLSDPEGTQWSEFRAHAAQCPVCSAEIEAWLELDQALGALPEPDEADHPTAREFVDYRRQPDSLSAGQRARIAEHLSQCEECREEDAFVASFDFSRLDALRTAPMPAAALWREAAGAAKEHVYELTSRLVIEMRKLAAVFAEVPSGLVAVPYATSVHPMRGERTSGQSGPTVTPGQSIKLAVGDSGLNVQLAVERQPSGRLRLTLELGGGGRGPVAVSLRQGVGSESSLVAAQSTENFEPFIVENLAPGEYLLEVWEIEPQRRFQIQIQVSPSASEPPPT